MIKISTIVQDLMDNDDIVKGVAARGWLNNMAYARSIHKEVEEKAFNKVQLGSITAAVNRYVKEMKPIALPSEKDIQQISVQTNLAGITFERSEEISEKIRALYQEVQVNNKMYLTITQGINEITIIGEQSIIEVFRKKLERYKPIYDISNIVGINIKFGLKYMSIPNLFYLLVRKLALQNINIIEIVSTATELTFILNKADTAKALNQLQKGL